MEAISLSPNISAKSLSNLKGSFRNLELISKLSLVARFDQELAEYGLHSAGAEKFFITHIGQQLLILPL